MAHLLLFYAPFGHWRRLQVADHHAACEWAEGAPRLVQEDYPEAWKITLVMANLNPHTGTCLYKAVAPELASALLDKLECVYSPKHGSWLNMAEGEFSVLSGQCLSRRRPDQAAVNAAVTAWVAARNRSDKPAAWRFTAENAQLKLKRLYPKVNG